jgi:VWFA-related protein
MKRHLAFVVAWSVAFGLTGRAQSPAATSQSPAQQEPAPVFRTGADAVSVEASVRRDRRSVTGLKAADFELLDNGVLQEITDISYERLPIDITVLLDVSASVTGSTLDDLRRALKQLRADLGSQDRLRLLTFNQRVRRLVDFTDAPAAIEAALGSLSGGGSSAVFDSLAVALAAPVPRGRRHLVVLFSDGQDSSSIIDAETLLDVAKRSTPTVAVVLASPSRQRPASLLRTSSKLTTSTIDDLSARIAEETGGFVATIERDDNLTSTFRRVLEQFRSTYVLYFTPRGVERSGTHTLEVRVKGAKVEIRARKEYVWR